MKMTYRELKEKGAVRARKRGYPDIDGLFAIYGTSTYFLSNCSDLNGDHCGTLCERYGFRYSWNCRSVVSWDKEIDCDLHDISLLFEKDKASKSKTRLEFRTSNKMDL